ncbi:hypothetical protein V8C42DRAFT_332539 [Trichoderma barbatum]
MAGTSNTQKTAPKQALVEVSNNSQLQKWLLQPSSEDPWIPAGCIKDSIERVQSRIMVNDNKGDISSNCATQGSILESKRNTRH